MSASIEKRLHIEIVQATKSVLTKESLSELVKNELDGYPSLSTSSSITVFQNASLGENISSILICEIETQKGWKECTDIKLRDFTLVFHVYRLNNDFSSIDLLTNNGEDSTSAAVTFWALPSTEFHGLWESLVFEDDVKSKLVRYASTVALYASKGVNSTIVSSNRIVLLHGPPGTGKTTLCKAAAQKVSIRLADEYKYTVFLEINAHSLFSKYFSESGKLVVAMFAKVLELVESPSTLVCLLMDEVESLTHSRKNSSSTAEPSDAMRVVNAVLTQLDNIKRYRNVIIFTTSNISKSVDEAFIDRADIKFSIDLPSVYPLYTILKSIVDELRRVGLVTGNEIKSILNKVDFDEMVNDYEKKRMANLKDPADTEPSYALLSLAEMCCQQRLSGRGVRKLPILCHSFHLSPESPVSIVEFVQSMIKTLLMHRNDQLIHELT